MIRSAFLELTTKLYAKNPAEMGRRILKEILGKKLSRMTRTGRNGFEKIPSAIYETVKNYVHENCKKAHRIPSKEYDTAMTRMCNTIRTAQTKSTMKTEHEEHEKNKTEQAKETAATKKKKIRIIGYEKGDFLEIKKPENAHTSDVNCNKQDDIIKNSLLSRAERMRTVLDNARIRDIAEITNTDEETTRKIINKLPDLNVCSGKIKQQSKTMNTQDKKLQFNYKEKNVTETSRLTVQTCERHPDENGHITNTKEEKEGQKKRNQEELRREERVKETHEAEEKIQKRGVDHTKRERNTEQAKRETDKDQNIQERKTGQRKRENEEDSTNREKAVDQLDRENNINQDQREREAAQNKREIQRKTREREVDRKKEVKEGNERKKEVKEGKERKKEGKEREKEVKEGKEEKQKKGDSIEQSQPKRERKSHKKDEKKGKTEREPREQFSKHTHSYDTSKFIPSRTTKGKKRSLSPTIEQDYTHKIFKSAEMPSSDRHKYDLTRTRSDQIREKKNIYDQHAKDKRLTRQQTAHNRKKY